MELGQQDAGGRRTMAVGEELVVTLAENPSTGYRWQVEAGNPILRESGDHYDGPADRPGAPGLRRLSFIAVGPGEMALLLAKRRSWEAGPGTEAFSIDLSIQ